MKFVFLLFLPVIIFYLGYKDYPYFKSQSKDPNLSSTDRNFAKAAASRSFSAMVAACVFAIFILLAIFREHV